MKIVSVCGVLSLLGLAACSSSSTSGPGPANNGDSGTSGTGNGCSCSITVNGETQNAACGTDVCVQGSQFTCGSDGQATQGGTCATADAGGQDAGGTGNDAGPSCGQLGDSCQSASSCCDLPGGAAGCSSSNKCCVPMGQTVAFESDCCSGSASGVGSQQTCN